MQLIDIKNDLAKIIYTPLSKELCLADFLIIGDENQNLLAQIIHIESTSKPNANLALVKFILSVNKDGVVSSYNGYAPSREAQISYMEPDEVAQLLKATEETMPWGAVASHKGTYVSLDVNFLKNKPYIQCDNLENASDIVNNIVSGLRKNNKKVVLIDFDGIYSDVRSAKISLCKDFKLPLNYESLDYIYEHDLDGMDLQSRAMIQDIILDLQQYVKTTKEGFLPFKTFKTVVDNEYKKAANAGVILLRNKLIKYEQQELFAQSEDDFSSISKQVEKEDILLIDASTVRPTWQKIVLNFILSQIQKECFVVLNLTDLNSDKRTITQLYATDSKVFPIVTTSYTFSEAQLLKAIAKNLVLFAPIEKINDFAGYNSFLSKLSYDEFIVWGADTLHIPMILKLKLINNTHVSNQAQDEITRSVDDIFRSSSKLEEQRIEAAQGVADEQEQIETMEPAETPVEPEVQPLDSDEVGFSASDLFEPAQQQPLPPELFEIKEKQDETEKGETSFSPLSDDFFLDLDAQENLVPQVQQAVETPAQNILADDELSDETLDLIDEIEIVEQKPENDFVEEEIDYDNIFSEDDLDLIDEMNSQSTPTMSVPVFKAEAETRQNALGAENCKEGMFVHHAKYGKGLVEKVISYGNKTLCSIQFDNVGRRLLDPNLAELTSV